MKLQGNIVSLQDLKMLKGDGHLTQVEAYWRRLLIGGSLPLRSSVRPKDIEDTLAFSFIGEAVTPCLVKMRVAGTHLNNLIGCSASGMPVTALFHLNSRDILSRASEALFTEPAMVRINCTSPAGPGREALQGQLIMMPLRSDMGDVTRALGCFVTQGIIGRCPRKFVINELVIDPVFGAETREFTCPASIPATAAESAAPLIGRLDVPPRLRLVISND